MSGVPLTTNPPFGYMKNPENKKEWIIDETAAVTVKQIFKMCVAGLGPSQIAKRLKEQELLTPTEYWISIGRKCSKAPSIKYGWCADTVGSILSKQEYCGDTVNFRYTTKSFKNKKKIEKPRDEWKIFPNTHPAIIDRDTFELVQQLRENKRRPNRTGIVSMFSGLLYCADCKEKLYYSSTNNYKRDQSFFFCSAYRKNSAECSAHFIREKVLYELVLENIQRVFLNIHFCEKEFARKQMQCYAEDKKKELSRIKREITKSKNRIAEIDKLIQTAYESNVKGKITEEHFEVLTRDYELEQYELKQKLPEMESYLENQTDQIARLETFIKKVKSTMEPTGLTAELLNEFIDKIYVHESRWFKGKRAQIIDIHYNGVGILKEISPEEMEEQFQKHYQNKRKNGIA